MPLFSGNVWKVCAQPTVMGWRDPICPLKPPAKMALIGETQGRSYVGRLIAARQSLPCFRQTKLDKPGVRSQMKFTFKTTCQREAVGARLPREVRQTDIFTQMRIKIIACAMGHRRALQLRGQPFSPVTMGGDLREQVIHGALLHNFHFIVVKRSERVANRTDQLRITRECLRKMKRVTSWRGGI